MEDFKFVIMKDIIKKSLLFPDKVLFMFETSVEIHWIHESRINKMKINQSTVDMTSADGSLVFILTDQGQIFFGDSRKVSVNDDIFPNVLDKFKDLSAISLFFSRYYDMFFIGHRNKTCSQMIIENMGDPASIDFQTVNIQVKILFNFNINI